MRNWPAERVAELSRQWHAGVHPKIIAYNFGIGRSHLNTMRAKLQLPKRNGVEDRPHMVHFTLSADHFEALNKLARTRQVMVPVLLRQLIAEATAE